MSESSGNNNDRTGDALDHTSAGDSPKNDSPTNKSPAARDAAEVHNIQTVRDDTPDAQPRFAADGSEAKVRYHCWYDVDPYPEILPALLNSAEIEDYVSATGMIAPFNSSVEKLKPASYEADLLGRVVYWEDGEKRDQLIRHGEKFLLRKNSIAFAQIEPELRLPAYIAMRFNLRILHVYRGLLLGTGPLVDPGFQGKLFIPLHNLTTNDYELVGGEGLIWMEFTKLSWSNHTPKEHCVRPKRLGVFHSFPERKWLQELDYYLQRSSPHKPIQSSIPAAIFDAKNSAEKALQEAKASATSAREIKQDADKAARFWRRIGGVAGVGIAIGLTALIVPFMMAYFEMRRDLLAHEERMRTALQEVRDLLDQQRRPAGVDGRGVARDNGPSPQNTFPAVDAGNQAISPKIDAGTPLLPVPDAGKQLRR